MRRYKWFRLSKAQVCRQYSNYREMSDRPFRDHQRKFFHLTTRDTIEPEVRSWFECRYTVDHKNMAPLSSQALMRYLRQMRDFVFAKFYHNPNTGPKLTLHLPRTNQLSLTLLLTITLTLIL